MSTYTPGPWEYSVDGIWATSQWNARVKIATITSFSRMNGIDSVANARLIVAAPDMLSALRRILEKSPDREVALLAAAAIERATSGQLGRDA